MKKAEITAVIYRLNEIADLVGRQGDSAAELRAQAASDLRWALAEGGLSLRERIGKLARANRVLGRLETFRENVSHPDYLYLLDTTEIVLSEIGRCAGEKRHDWNKLYLV
jgi:hypothetical protein